MISLLKLYSKNRKTTQKCKTEKHQIQIKHHSFFTLNCCVPASMSQKTYKSVEKIVW